VLSPIFSPRTTNPEGRNGRNPTIVRITRSADTFTGAHRTPGVAIATRFRRVAHPTVATPAAMRKPRRDVCMPLLYTRTSLLEQFTFTARPFIKIRGVV